MEAIIPETEQFIQRENIKPAETSRLRRYTLRLVLVTATSFIFSGCSVPPVDKYPTTPFPTEPRPTLALPTQIHLSEQQSLQDIIQVTKISPHDNIVTIFDKEELYGANSVYYLATSQDTPHCKVLFAVGPSEQANMLNRHQFHQVVLSDEYNNAVLLQRINTILNAAEQLYTNLQALGIPVPSNFVIRIIPSTNQGEDWTGKSVPDDLEYNMPQDIDFCTIESTIPIVALFDGQEEYLIEVTIHELCHHIMNNAYCTLYEALAVAFSYIKGNFTTEMRFENWAEVFMENQQIPIDTNSYGAFGFYIWICQETGIDIADLANRLANSWKQCDCPTERETNSQVFLDVLEGTSLQDQSLNQLLAHWLAQYISNQDVYSPTSIYIYEDVKIVNNIVSSEPNGTINIPAESLRVSYASFEYLRIVLDYDADIQQLIEGGFRIALNFDPNEIIIYTRQTNGDLKQLNPGDAIKPSQELLILNTSGGNSSLDYNWTNIGN